MSLSNIAQRLGLVELHWTLVGQVAQPHQAQAVQGPGNCGEGRGEQRCDVAQVQPLME